MGSVQEARNDPKEIMRNLVPFANIPHLSVTD
jgi:hypothetical protein